MPEKIKEDCIYGGDAYAELGNVSPDSKTLGLRLPLNEAKRLREALNKAITGCELDLLPLKKDQKHMITVTAHRQNGHVTILAKKRRKSLGKGTTGKTTPLKERN